MPESNQVDIRTLSVEALWKLAFEQQQTITNLLAQIQMTQSNISTIQDEIKSREKPSSETDIHKK